MTKVSLFRHCTWVDKPTLCYEWQKRKQMNKEIKNYNKSISIMVSCYKSVLNPLRAEIIQGARKLFKTINPEEGD